MSLKRGTIFQIVLVILLLIVGVSIWILLGEHRKPFKRIKKKIPLPVVKTKRFYPRPITITIKGYGTVKPVKRVVISPEVSGKVVYVSSSFVKGGFLKKGETFLKIDPSDYEILLNTAKAQVEIAKNQLLIVQEEAKQGIYEWKLVHPKKEVPFMVAKRPQLNTALAKLKEAEANLKKAELNLKRTLIKASFDSIVAEKNVDKGSYVVKGENLGVLLGTDEAEVYVPLDLKDVRWIDVPGFTVPYGHKGSKAILRLCFGERELKREGIVVRSEGVVDENTRMIKVIVRLKKPYSTNPPFAFGSFVDVVIEGKTIKNGFKIPIEAVHEGSSVWIVKGQRLYVKKVRVMRFEDNFAIVSYGLNPGDEVVLSPLPYVKNGMRVKVLLEDKNT